MEGRRLGSLRGGSQLPAGLLSTPSGPGESRSLLLFNIHLEKLNLASWKPAHRVKFLATSKVFHFPGPAMLWFPLVSASEQPSSWACLSFPPTAARLSLRAQLGWKEGLSCPRQAAQGRLGSTCPEGAPQSHPADAPMSRLPAVTEAAGRPRPS